MPQTTTHAHSNALIHEKSPYLLQHARNPVNWQAWSDAAFEQARREDKPIFLSIGYATCHWCHVMERESFENEATAALVNEHFVAIKVDREERPDIDAIYMAVCQAMTGHGGWPLSVFMTPSAEPFFVGTYFPPRDHPNRPGFPTVLQQIAKAWRSERENIEAASASVTAHLNSRTKSGIEESSARNSSVEGIVALLANIAARAFERYEQTFDPHYGGFGAQPKFPSPQNLLFLLRHYKRTRNADALQMVERTLQEMRAGGVFDHIGYGFHRYSTDRFWLLPHFEKMLYDQAMMAIACIETFQATQNELYSRIAEEIFTYVLRDMTAPEGGFYSAEDADSEGHEGKFYVWSHEEVLHLLGDSDGELFCAVYNIRAEGNFADEASGEQTGENIPHLRASIDAIAEQRGIDVTELRMRLNIMRQRLFDEREARIHPLKDDKVLADWNGLMIAAMAIGGRALGNALYTQAAERAWRFIQHTMTTAEGRLLHRWRDGEAAILAFLDDYAFLAWGVFELYQTTQSIAYLRDCKRLCDEMLRLFAAPDGGFYLSAADNERLITRTKEAYDGAIPSGNSVAASILARLGKLTSNEAYQEAARQTIHAFATSVQAYPTGFAQMLIADDFLNNATQEIIIAGNPSHERRVQEQRREQHHEQTIAELSAMLTALAEVYLPFAVVALNTQPHELAPFVEQAAYQTAQNGAATAYVCEQFVCQQPVTSADEFRTLLAALS